MNELHDKMAKSIESLKTKLSGIRTGRANPDLLNSVKADYYGALTPITQLANVSASDNSTLVINVYDASAVSAVEKGILTSDLNLNPQTDGSVIRLRLPDLTEERRKDLIKVIKKEAEDSKVSLRNIRRDYLDGVKKSDDSTEDDLKHAQDEVQKVIDKYTHDIDELVTKKESEILTV